MTDPIQEELAIMDERSQDRVVLSDDLLDRPLRTLCEDPVETLDISATVGDAVELMRARKFGAVIITKDGVLAGIFTERDLLLKHVEPDPARPLREVMTPDPEWLMLDDPIVYVMNKMHVGGFRHVPIVDSEMVPLHVVSVRDVLRFVLDEIGDTIITIPPEPFRGERRLESG